MKKKRKKRREREKKDQNSRRTKTTTTLFFSGGDDDESAASLNKGQKKPQLKMSDDFVYVGTPLEAVAVKPQQQGGGAGQRRRDADRQQGIITIDGRRRKTDGDSNPNPASTSLPVAEQVALDAQGRRRFHGAFTGGFSAGYFNSVGSAEGWKPSSFVSSRRHRGDASTSSGVAAGDAPMPQQQQQQQQQRTARDFMDEDELAEMEAKEAAALKTARGYSRNAREEEAEAEEAVAGAGAVAVGGGSRSGGGNDDSAAALASLLLSSTAAGRRRVADGVGARLLREMGWRRETFDDDEDNGDGGGGGESDDDGGGRGGRLRLRRPLSQLAVASRHGLGFDPFVGAPEFAAAAAAGATSSGASALALRRGGGGGGGAGDSAAAKAKTTSAALALKARRRRGVAFGVGALEDADDEFEGVAGEGWEEREREGREGCLSETLRCSSEEAAEAEEEKGRSQREKERWQQLVFLLPPPPLPASPRPWRGQGRTP